MSAFMVNDETINRVMAYLVNANERRDWLATYFLKEHGYPLDTFEQQQHLAIRLFALNKRGVECRYGNGEAKKFRPLDYQYRRTIPPGAVQAFKSLSCLLYQCSEGNVPETKLYKLLDRIKGYIAEDIVHNLKEYDLAKWD